MLRKIVTYNSQNYATILGSGLVPILVLLGEVDLVHRQSVNNQILSSASSFIPPFRI